MSRNSSLPVTQRWSRARGREKVIALTEQGRAYAGELLGQVYAAERSAMEQTLGEYSGTFVDAVAYFAQPCAENLTGARCTPRPPAKERRWYEFPDPL